MPHRRQRGQSAVELVALVPALVVAALLGWQACLAAHAWLVAGGAARAGARGAEVGAPVREAALRTLAPALAGTASVRGGAGGDGAPVRVRLRVPRALPWLPGMEVEGSAPGGEGG